MSNSIESEKFRLGDAAYQDVKKIIKEMCNVAAGKGKYLDYEKAMWSVDLILQATLLCVAWADGVVLDSEVAFIKNITEYGDLVDLANHVNSKTITWNHLTLLDQVDRDTAIKCLAKYCCTARENTRDFITEFSQIDAVTTKDYLEELSTTLGVIGLYLAEVDGDVIGDNQLDNLSGDLRNEVTLLIRFINSLLDEPWSEEMDS